jgi:hypothetical protein
MEELNIFNLKNKTLKSRSQRKSYVVRVEDRHILKKILTPNPKDDETNGVHISDGGTNIFFKSTEQTKDGLLHEDDDNDDNNDFPLESEI